MRLPNIDHILEDFENISDAHRYYRTWIDSNLSDNQQERTHFAPFGNGEFTQHVCECVFLLAYQHGASVTLARVCTRMSEATKALYDRHILLPEIYIFVGETGSGFSLLRRGGACAVKLDFRSLMLLSLSQFFLGVGGGTVQTRQLATWLILAVVHERGKAFDPALIQLAHEAMAMDQKVFWDLIASVADLVIQHEVGHAIADQLPSDFTNVVYVPNEKLPSNCGERIGAGYVAFPRRQAPDPHLLKRAWNGFASMLGSALPPPEAYRRLVLPESLKHWDKEFIADCFSILGNYAACLEVYDGNRRKAVEAICDGMVSYNLTFFAVWCLQDLRTTTMGLNANDPTHVSHPDGLTRCDIVMLFLNYLMACTIPKHRSSALTRSVEMHKVLWYGPIEPQLRLIRTYLTIVPEAFTNFVERPLKSVLGGCTYDEFKGVNGHGRLLANFLESADQWDGFHRACHMNGKPVFVELAEKLALLDVNFVSQERGR